MKVATRVQHHPDRARLVRPLLARLPADAVVVLDPDPTSSHRSPLRTYIEALRLPTDATHVLIVQDDAVPCLGFEEQMLAAIAERPDDMVAFFAPGAGGHRRQMILAHRAGDRWARLTTGWVPTVALLWPAKLALQAAEWIPTKYPPDRRIADDSPVGHFCTRRKLRVWATVPSFVQHPDCEPSLIGKRHRNGANRSRVAAVPWGS